MYLCWSQEYQKKGISLGIQWLRLCTFTAGSTSSIPGRGTKIPYATQNGKKVEKKKKKLSLYQKLKALNTSVCLYVCINIYVCVQIYILIYINKWALLLPYRIVKPTQWLVPQMWALRNTSSLLKGLSIWQKPKVLFEFYIM